MTGRDQLPLYVLLKVDKHAYDRGRIKVNPHHIEHEDAEDDKEVAQEQSSYKLYPLQYPLFQAKPASPETYWVRALQSVLTWAGRTENEFWCSADSDRFQELPPDEVDSSTPSLTWKESKGRKVIPVRKGEVDDLKECHSDDNASKRGPTEAITMIYTVQDTSKTPPKIIPGGRATAIDMCKSSLTFWHDEQWVVLDEARVERSRTADFQKDMLEKWEKTSELPWMPIEATLTLGHTRKNYNTDSSFPKLFHTVQGGQKKDEPQEGCYGFQCFVNLNQNILFGRSNAGLMLQLLKWAYIVDKEGVVSKLE
ncbi:hypothetical protein GQ53DRAFT_759932 [Thozetella sp. PMI_491]|nr:hypothetical protein GQ53DRAFT_759932 [Thozetella sp. PMI_491]